MRLHFAVNAFIRSESAVQVAAMFPLFRVTVQILTNVSLRFSNSTDKCWVSNSLGMHFDWLHRTPVLAISLSYFTNMVCQNTMIPLEILRHVS